MSKSCPKSLEMALPVALQGPSKRFSAPWGCQMVLYAWWDLGRFNALGQVLAPRQHLRPGPLQAEARGPGFGRETAAEGSAGYYVNSCGLMANHPKRSEEGKGTLVAQVHEGLPPCRGMSVWSLGGRFCKYLEGVVFVGFRLAK